MCAITPIKIIKIASGLAKTSDGREIKTNLIPGVKVGDFVQVFANMGLEIIDKENALAQIKELSVDNTND